MSLDIDELEDPHHKADFRRANGAPMIVDANGKNQRYSRPSGWGKELDDENALVNWKLNRAVLGVAQDPAIQARAMAAKDDDRETWKQLREDAINAGRGAQSADIGTALHSMTERWEDPDDDFHPGPPYEDHLIAYSAEIERLGLESVYAECHMVNDEYRCAGTADRIFRLTKNLVTPDASILDPGTLVIGDLKTGTSLDFSAPGYAVQLALYAASQLYDVTADEYLPTPEIDQRWGLLLHLPSQAETPRCEALWVDLEVGRWGAYLVNEVRKWRRNWKSGDFSLGEVHAIPASLAEMTERSTDLTDDEWLAHMKDWAKERMAQVRDNDDAMTHLKRFWPDGLPTPKQGIDTCAHMTVLLDFLDDVERRFSLPFVPSPAPSSGHRSGVRSTNQPPSTNKE